MALNMKRSLIAIAFLTMGFLLSCNRERTTAVNVSGDTEPLFRFAGDGTLATFAVYGPPMGSSLVTAFDEAEVIWKIVPNMGYFKGKKVAGLSLQYGNVLDGYHQVVPENRAKPPKLEPGKVYFYWAEAANAAGRSGYFTITSNNAKEITIANLCVQQVGGRMQNVRCDSHEPFVLHPN